MPLRVPKFGDPHGIDSLLAADGERIRGAERHVIDLRGVGGRSDYRFRHLLSLNCPPPIRNVSISALVTGEYQRAHRELAADTTLPEAQRAMLVSWIEQVEPALSGRYELPDDVREEPEALERPRGVAVLVDRGCASSCEQFPLAARQGAKVTLDGEPSAAVLDVGNVRRAAMPGGLPVLFYATSSPEASWSWSPDSLPSRWCRGE